MKKRMGYLLVAIFCTILITGCAANPYYGAIFSNVQAPEKYLHAPVDAQSASKVGTGSCMNILGLFAVGDASLETVMKNADIKKIHHVDYQYTSFLFIFCQYTIKVYGE